MSGKLYLVGTPIGNLSDFSPRGVETLQKVDFIAAEDTRVTVKLLNRFEIKKPMVSYYAHNLRERGEQIISRILAGESCALVSDAGMPCISDPGEDLVRLCTGAGITIEAVPGPSAGITALCLSGLPTGQFCFEGFLPATGKERRERLQVLQNETRTMVFYEAPHKLIGTLQDLLESLGDRPVAVAKELTKLHETVERTTLAQAAQSMAGHPPKGEYVLVVSGADPVKGALSLEQAVALAHSLQQQGYKPSDAAREAAKQSGIAKAEIYKALVE